MAASSMSAIETPEEIAVKADFRTNIWTVFQELYDSKWDQGASLTAPESMADDVQQPGGTPPSVSGSRRLPPALG